MHPHLTLHRHPMCAEIIEEFQKCHIDHPLGKFFGECTDLKVKLDKCFRQEKAVKRKANFEESKRMKERLREFRKEISETREEMASEEKVPQYILQSWSRVILLIFVSIPSWFWIHCRK